MRCGLGKSADGLVERVIAAVATNGVEDKLKLAWVLKLGKKRLVPVALSLINAKQLLFGTISESRCTQDPGWALL